MSKINPFMEAARYYGDLTKVYFAFDVDLALQPSMDTANTDLNRANMWELYDRTDGGVGIFTGRTHQSAKITFGHDYEGVYEHYSVARFGFGHDVTYMAPEIEIEKMGQICKAEIEAFTTFGESEIVRVEDHPASIRNGQGLAVFIEKKNTSIALVHTTLHGDESQEEKQNHLARMRAVLNPVAEKTIAAMGLQDTHMVKIGNDAVELVPKHVDSKIGSRLNWPQKQIELLHSDGLSKATAVHNFMALHQHRHAFVMTGDSSPDLDAMVVGKADYNGKGIYVSNGIPLKDQYHHAVDWNIDRHEMTWPLIGDTVSKLRELAPIVKIMPPAGNGTPNLGGLN